jgi:hypothetical protein
MWIVPYRHEEREAEGECNAAAEINKLSAGKWSWSSNRPGGFLLIHKKRVA